jgi:hypothetical protein
MVGKRGGIVSGHESFACRYGWLPKLYEAVKHDRKLFADDEKAIVTLGLGKNMVRSIRFWGDVFGLIETDGRQVLLSQFARNLFDPKDGSDPYLEDGASLWRLHWRATTRANLGAWTVAFLQTPDAEMTKQRLIESVRQQAVQSRGSVTSGTVAQHVDIFLRTYDCGRLQLDSAVIEDTLSCPLQELSLLEVVDLNGTPTIRFRRGAKPDLDVPSFAFALGDFWQSAAPKSRAVSLRSLMFDPMAPGTVFRLDEVSVHRHLEAICRASKELELREDGLGGTDLVARRGNPAGVLGEIAWQ